MRKNLIVGGGYAGFYTAWQLEKRLRPDEAEVVVVDPRPYMTYQPFLPEVAAGGVEARHAAVSLRRHLHRTAVVPGTVSRIDHEHRQVEVELGGGGTTTGLRSRRRDRGRSRGRGGDVLRRPLAGGQRGRPGPRSSTCPSRA